MLDNLIKSKNILLISIFSLLSWSFVVLFKNFDLQHILTGYILIGLMLWHTHYSLMIKSPFITNVLFSSFLVLYDFKSFSPDSLWSIIVLIIAFLIGEYLYDSKKNLVFYDCTILIFIACVLYPPSVIFMLFVYFLMINKGIRELNVWISPFFVGILSAILFGGISYLIDFDYATFGSEKLKFFNTYKEYNPLIINVFNLLILAFLLISALIDHFRTTYLQSILRKKSYELVIYFLLLAFLSLVFSKEALLFTFFPAAIIIGKFIYFIRFPILRWFMLLYFPIAALITVLWR